MKLENYSKHINGNKNNNYFECNSKKWVTSSNIAFNAAVGTSPTLGLEEAFRRSEFTGHIQPANSDDHSQWSP